LHYYLRQEDNVFIVVGLSVCLLAVLLKKALTDFYEIIRIGR